MTASAIKAGETYVRMYLDKAGLERGLKDVESRLRKWSATATRLGASLGLLGVAGVAAFTKAAMAANEVELTSRRLDAVFQGTAGEARKFSRDLAKEIGDSRFAIEKTIVTFKSFFSEIIAGQDDQEAFSRNMTRLSRDFAAFQGLSNEDSLQRFISALSGSPEVLDRFGINLKAAAVDAELAAMGIEETTATAEEFQKVIARMTIIERTLGSQGAIGKAREEVTQFAGRLRAAKAAVFDFLAAVGQAVIPILKPMVAAFTGLAGAAETIVRIFPPIAVAVGATAAGLVVLGAGLVAAGIAMTAFSITAASAAFVFKTLGFSVLDLREQFRAITQVSLIMQESFAKTAVGFALGSKAADFYSMAMVRATAATVKLKTGLKAFATAAIPASVVLLALGGSAESFIAVTVAASAAAVAMKVYTARTGQAVTAASLMASANTKLAASFKLIGAATAFALAPIKGLLTTMAGIGFLAGGLISAAGILAAGVGAIAFELGFLNGIINAVSSAWRGFKDAGKSALNFIGVNTEWLSKTWNDYIKSFKEGADVVRGYLRGDFTGRTRSGAPAPSKKEVEAAEASAKRLTELRERLEDAQIEAIDSRHRREMANIKARYDREVAGSEVLISLEKERAMAIAEAQRMATSDGGASLTERKRQINEEYDTRIQLAKDTNAELVAQYAVYAQQVKNIERQLAREIQDFRIAALDAAERARLERIEDTGEREIALLKQRQRLELREAALSSDGAPAKIAALNEKQREELATLENELARQKNADELTLVQRLTEQIADLKTAAIEDEQMRAVQAIEDRYARELQLAKGNAQAIALLNEQRTLEEAAVRKQFADEQAEVDKKAAEDRAKNTQQLQRAIQGLQVDLANPREFERSLARLDLARKQALEDAGGDKQIEGLVNQQFDLQRQLLERGQTGEPGRAFGSFSGLQIGAFGRGASNGRTREQELLEKQILIQERQQRTLESIDRKQGAS